MKNAPSNFLRIPRPMTLAGFDPLVQLIHVEDTARGFMAIADSDKALGEVVNVVGTPYTLNYRSSRVPGKSSASSCRITTRTCARADPFADALMSQEKDYAETPPGPRTRRRAGSPLGLR